MVFGCKTLDYTNVFYFIKNNKKKMNPYEIHFFSNNSNFFCSLKSLDILVLNKTFAKLYIALYTIFSSPISIILEIPSILTA